MLRKILMSAALCSVGICAAQEPAQRSLQILGWRFGIGAYSFNRVTFFEAIEKTASLGQKNIEGYFLQKVSPGIIKTLDYDLTDEESTAVKVKLDAAGVKMPSYYIHKIPADENVCRRLFEFARKLEVETIVSEPEPAALDTVEKFCNQYNISLAIHNHAKELSPAYWNPEAVLKACEGRSRRIGICADVGFWVKAGFKPLDTLKRVKDRIISLHVHDLNELSSQGHDVPWGTGAMNIEELFREAYRLELKPLIVLEYSYNFENSMPEIAQSIAFFNKAIQPIASFQQDYASRTSGIRRLAGVSPEEREKIENALPSKAAAKPNKARKLLIVDANIGRGGHPSIPHSNLAVELMGKKLAAWTTVLRNDVSVWKPESLKQYNAVYLNNTIGDIFQSSEARDSFAAFVRNGGGVIGNHATTVTASDWPEFEKIMGGKGAMHRMTDEKVTIKIDEPKSPINATFSGQSFVFADEIFRYTTTQMRGLDRVLLSLDVEKTDMNQGRCFGKCFNDENDYPVSWIHYYGKGRVFYCSLGHNPYVFWDAKILAHFLAGIQFALGDLKADARPVPPRK